MMETVVLLNNFWDQWYTFQEKLINKKLKRTVFIQNRDQYIFFKKLKLLFSKDVLNG